MLAALCAMRSVGFPRPAPSLSRCKGRVLDLEARVKKQSPEGFHQRGYKCRYRHLSCRIGITDEKFHNVAIFV